MVLKRSAQVVSVATLRVFGTRFAELPFVATRQGHRRAGNCRLLVQVREGKELALCLCWWDMLVKLSNANPGPTLHCSPPGVTAATARRLRRG